MKLPFFDFEREVVQKVLAEDDILVITTSNTEIKQWRNYDVRVKHKNFQIPSLTLEEIKSLAIQRHLNPEVIFASSLGYPLALQWLCNNPELSEQEVAQKVSSLFYDDLPLDTIPLAKAACLLPVFNVAVLRLVLPSGSHNRGTESLYAEYIERIRNLMRIGLVHWDMDMGTYRFTNSTVRQLLARNILFQSSGDFHNTHVVATKYYQDEARRASFLHYHLVSALYHLAQSHRDKEAEQVGKICQEWVKKNLSSWVGADWNAVTKAWKTGAGDISVIDEIKDLIGMTAYVEIVQLLDQIHQNVEVIS